MNNKILRIELLISLIVFIIVFLIITYVLLLIKNSVIESSSDAKVVNVVTNMIENMKSRNYLGLNAYINDLSAVGIKKSVEDDAIYISVNGDEFAEKIFDTEIPKEYIVDIVFSKIDDNFDINKHVDINVIYIENGIEKEYSISTELQIENLDECNLPVITNEYFMPLGFDLDDYDVIPIKFQNELNSFVVTNVDDDMWFNYTNKDWAKVLVFPRDGDSLQDLFIKDNKVCDSIYYNNTNIRVENFIYVWIPNFSIRNEISYFRYGSTKKTISMGIINEDSNYLYLNKIGDEIPDISKECSFEGIYGVWRKFGDYQDPYYSNFNMTKFAPMNIR